MKTLGKDKVVYAMSAANAPQLRVQQGEEFCLVTEDCYSGALKSPQDRWGNAFTNINPATGPVFVEGAKPGGVLCLEILQIKTRDFAVMAVSPNEGAIPRCISHAETSILPIRGDMIELRPGFSLKANPMIGVLGLAPAKGEIPNGVPGEHGGNMDCKEITAGAKVYLPVGVEGALIAAGDMHALMGDGEVCVCGAETSGEITMKASLTDKNIPTPCVETAGHFLFLASGKTLDGCQSRVLHKAHKFLTQCVGFSDNEAARLMSLTGDLRISQVVDPLKTLKFAVPKSILEPMGWR